MQVELSPAASAFVTEKVSAGDFDSAADVVEAAVFLLEESNDWVLEAYKDEIAEGLRAADEGRLIASSPEMFQQLRDRIRRRHPHAEQQ